MDEQRFREILDESITPLRQDIKDLKVGVGDLKKDVGSLKRDVNTLKVSVLTLEQTVGSYADSYQVNQANIERLDIRMNTVEEELGIDTPEELKVPYFSKQTSA